ncbi:hypothetical protein PLIIFM63780_009470 [Purpureocillium lilacinum]|nr:hypothetical protein PLIIFM63780_009470 [Purpureocillium lilacinum]
MPRLPPWLLRQAKRQSPNLAALLPACRDIRSARNELRWIEQHVHETTRRVSHSSRRVRELCQSRGRGAPLQYVLGSQPFGHLDIKCRPGVLIPRPETEAYTCHLVDLIKNGQIPGLSPVRGGRMLNIVDFCTGTGCIPLLLFASLQRWATRLNVLGVDIADAALRLANNNVHHNEELGNLSVNQLQKLQISRVDVLNDADIEALAETHWDIIVSNPPYVSQRVWDYGHGQLGYSVRKYEPKLALVPGQGIAVPDGWQHQDVFYARLLDIAAMLRPKAMLLELGDEAQAMSLQPPAPGYGVETLLWDVEVARGRFETLNGTIQEVYAQVLRLNPHFKLPEDPPVARGLNRKRSTVRCGNWPLTSKDRIQEGINYLRRLNGAPRNGPGPSNCGRVSCSYNAAIWWCNDNTVPKTLDSWNWIADSAQHILNTCAPGANMVSGQNFESGNWNTIVRRDSC